MGSYLLLVRWKLSRRIASMVIAVFLTMNKMRVRREERRFYKVEKIYAARVDTLPLVVVRLPSRSAELKSNDETWSVFRKSVAQHRLS